MLNSEIIELHRRVRKEDHKIYLDVAVEPFDFDYYDVHQGIFYKQGDFYGNHYKYHALKKFFIRSGEPLEWIDNAISRIPNLVFRKSDCEFGKDPTIKPFVQKNQQKEDEQITQWILNHPKLVAYNDKYIEYHYLDWCYSATLFGDVNRKLGLAGGNNQSKALKELEGAIKKEYGDYN